MTAKDSVEVKSSMLAYLKAYTPLTSLLLGVSGTSIKETQYQGTDWTFPAIRISVDLLPSVNGCGPDDADFIIETFVAEKSSLSADVISGTIYKLLHKRAFTSLGVNFPTVVVKKVVKAEASIYGWKSQVQVHTQCV